MIPPPSDRLTQIRARLAEMRKPEWGYRCSLCHAPEGEPHYQTFLCGDLQETLSIIASLTQQVQGLKDAAENILRHYGPPSAYDEPYAGMWRALASAALLPDREKPRQMTPRHAVDTERTDPT